MVPELVISFWRGVFASHPLQQYKKRHKNKAYVHHQRNEGCFSSCLYVTSGQIKSAYILQHIGPCQTCYPTLLSWFCSHLTFKLVILSPIMPGWVFNTCLMAATMSLHVSNDTPGITTWTDFLAWLVSLLLAECGQHAIHRTARNGRRGAIMSSTTHFVSLDKTLFWPKCSQ